VRRKEVRSEGLISYFYFVILEESDNTKVYKMASEVKIFAIEVRRDNSCSGGCIKVTYLPKLELYPNCSDINEFNRNSIFCMQRKIKKEV